MDWHGSWTSSSADTHQAVAAYGPALLPHSAECRWRKHWPFSDSSVSRNNLLESLILLLFFLCLDHSYFGKQAKKKIYCLCFPVHSPSQFIIIFFRQGCSWFTILCYFQVYNIVTQKFYRLYSIYSYKILPIFPVLYHISLYLLYFIHSDWYLLIPYPYLAHTSSSLPTSKHWFVFGICEFVSFLLNY